DRAAALRAAFYEPHQPTTSLSCLYITTTTKMAFADPRTYSCPSYYRAVSCRARRVAVAFVLCFQHCSMSRAAGDNMSGSTKLQECGSGGCLDVFMVQTSAKVSFEARTNSRGRHGQRGSRNNRTVAPMSASTQARRTPNVSTTTPLSAPTTCVDTDNGATNRFGNSCAIYSYDLENPFISICLDPYYDDDDFSSSMCCECPEECPETEVVTHPRGCEDWVDFLTDRAHSNLGGLGPDYTAPRELRYYGVGQLPDGVIFDLVYTNVTTYTPRSTDWNGVVGGMANINLLVGEAAVFRAEFVRNHTFCPVVPTRPKLTFCDIDHHIEGENEVIVLDGVSAVYTVEDGIEFDMEFFQYGSSTGDSPLPLPSYVIETIQSSVPGRKAKKYTIPSGGKFGIMTISRMFGHGCDNPLGPDELTNITCPADDADPVDQAKRCFMAEFADTSEFEIGIRISDPYPDGHFHEWGRNYGLGGTSKFFAEEGSFTCAQDYFDSFRTPAPTAAPTTSPTAHPTFSPTAAPTGSPTAAPTAGPTANPPGAPTVVPSASPTTAPTEAPTATPTAGTTASPTTAPTAESTATPTASPTPIPTVPPDEGGTGNFFNPGVPTASPTGAPTVAPTASPTTAPTEAPTEAPAGVPTASPTAAPGTGPTATPTGTPTVAPTEPPLTAPTGAPTEAPAGVPTASPTAAPGTGPTATPTDTPAEAPTAAPAVVPTASPTSAPGTGPTATPTGVPTAIPTASPATAPTGAPTEAPASVPTASPTAAPGTGPTATPTGAPTVAPTEPLATVPTEAPTAAPAGVPTASPTAAPTEAPTLSAVGDPHLVNVHGQHFDVMKSGVHVLLHVPFKARPSQVLLLVQADAQRVGGACADTYFMSVNMTGKWVASRVHALGLVGGGLSFSAGTGAVHTGSKWMSFGKVSLKVVHGRTKTGVAYLNFFARNLRHAGYVVGGLLGEDDHEEAATVSNACKSVIDI
ncbi:unnamed protein product, partial [Prorocentrum cordatum]